MFSAPGVQIRVSLSTENVMRYATGSQEMTVTDTKCGRSRTGINVAIVPMGIRLGLFFHPELNPRGTKAVIDSIK